MSEERRTGERGRWASQLRRVALVALFAIASSALLPFAHGSSSHFGDCGVCSVLVHGGAHVADIAPPSALAPVAVGTELKEVELVTAVPVRDFALRLARAPPLASVSA